MRVTLNIGNDQELRSYIKDMIKGQVLAVTREEITELVREEIGKKIKNTQQYQWERWVKEAIDKTVRDTLYAKLGLSNWGGSNQVIVGIVNNLVEEKVKKSLPNYNWTGLVEKIATEKIKALIK